MTHRDPTFHAVAKEQVTNIKEMVGCGACAMRGEKYWGKYSCRISQEPNKDGWCWRWCMDHTWSRND